MKPIVSTPLLAPKAVLAATHAVSVKPMRQPAANSLGSLRHVSTTNIAFDWPITGIVVKSIVTKNYGLFTLSLKRLIMLCNRVFYFGLKISLVSVLEDIDSTLE